MLRNLFRRKRSEADFAAEIRSHLELEADELEREGVTHDEARYQAIRTFGNVREAQERFYLRGRSEWFENLSRDLRYALRQLHKNPSFALTAILVLAFGMGAALTIFAFVDAALIRPLPYAQPSRLVNLFESIPAGPRFHLSWLDYLDWKRRNHVFESVAFYSARSLDFNSGGDFVLDTPEGGERVLGTAVSSGFFRTLGVAPIIGRDFREGEDRSSSSNLVILSYAAWQKRFSSDTHVVGRALSLNGVSTTIIGVLPRSFQFAPTDATDFWVIASSAGCNQMRGCHNAYGIARLRQGASIAAASAEMNNIAAQLEKENPQSNFRRGATVLPLSDVIVGDIRPLLEMLLAGAALLLLIAITNVASLLMVRAEKRRREIALRNALGASTTRLAWQFLTEGLLLASSATAVGLALALLGIRMLKSLIPANRMQAMPYLEHITLNGHMIAAAVALSCVITVVCTLTPMLRLATNNMRDGLADGGRSGTNNVWKRFGSNLVAVELATAMVLLVCAGLLGQSFYRLSQVDTGMDIDNLAVLHVMTQPCAREGERPAGCTAPPPASDGDEQENALADEVLATLRALPGTKSAAITTDAPVGDGDGLSPISFPDMPDLGTPEANGRWVSEDYFSTLKAPLLQGRGISVHDDAKSPYVAVVNHSLAKRFFGTKSPIGSRLSFPGGDAVEIVGVIDDIKEGQLDTETRPAFYEPFRQLPNASFFVIVRTSQDVESALPSIVKSLRHLNQNITPSDGETMAERIHDSPSAYMHRASAWVVGCFAWMALLLGVVGLYGVIAYSVSQRTREIGVRMALGAQRSTIHRMVLGEAVRLALTGMAVGIVCSLAAGSLLHGLLFGVSAWDPATLLAVAAMLSVAVLAASFIPARTAALVDPMHALRAE
ncbi:ADOP family duplicated permease [Silvibacterium acidisoli]|uniref:ADOP family duplicated permease n=1 Tax=Acidobacteriaceae bacterium ZG23-2 TaxID=2883246 RepID=UPI00406C27E1